MPTTSKLRNYFSRPKHSYVPKGESMTQQQFKDDCDINKIMAKYDKTGLITHLSTYEGRYDDIKPLDFTEATRIVLEGQQMFDDLPAKVRKEYDHDPVQFLEAMNDLDANQEKLQELGLLPIYEDVQKENSLKNQDAEAVVPGTKRSDLPGTTAEVSPTNEAT